MDDEEAPGPAPSHGRPSSRFAAGQQRAQRGGGGGGGAGLGSSFGGVRYSGGAAAEDMPELPDDVDMEEQRMLMAALTGGEYGGALPGGVGRRGGAGRAGQGGPSGFSVWP